MAKITEEDRLQREKVDKLLSLDLHAACKYAYAMWSGTEAGTKLEDWVRQRYSLAKCAPNDGDVHYQGENIEIKFSKAYKKGEFHFYKDNATDFLLFPFNVDKYYIFKLNRAQFTSLGLRFDDKDKRNRGGFTIGSFRSKLWMKLQPFLVEGGIDALDVYFGRRPPSVEIVFRPATLFEGGNPINGLRWASHGT